MILGPDGLPIAGSANASVGRGMMRSVGARNAVMFGGLKNPYQTSDSALIAMWDGQWNIGVGSHSYSSSIWKDLVGDSDLTRTAHGSWGDKYLQTDGIEYGAFGPVFPDYLTIQIVSQTNDNGIQQVIFASGITFTSVNENMRQLCITVDYENGVSTDSRSEIKRRTTDICQRTISYNSISSEIARSYYENNVSYYVYYNGTWGLRNVTHSSVGGFYTPDTSRLTFPSQSRIYAIRLYNRNLYQNERLLFYTIDKARFNLP